ncbi:c-type cytochrome [Usitatibacter palustris]|uniref:Cytochrome c-551 n=1 Tax=Usitatibacter palustris TaxID=2732487 RepID=A0A6M4H288_9PROT|nr:c-type cytochrome [Usitatibacter palustris]QJR13425.1 Cytochrome c-551 [Usitatibacter palustris]
MRKFALALPALALATLALPTVASEELMKKHACTACHQIDKKTVGPAYNDVAAKYAGDPKAKAMLIEKVKKGGMGTWGQIPMPPNSAVPDADVEKLVTYILSLKKK